MLEVLANRTYRHLFLAQVVALAGTGLTTVALALLAYELAGDKAGAVLGTALAIKMGAYVLVAPLAGAYVGRFDRRRLLIGLDAARFAVVLLLPWVDTVWHVYVLIFVLQSCSAAFTPAFQATIPEVLPREEDYTTALSLSRLAYDLENLLSPALAAALLTLISFHGLFLGTAVGFLASALLVVSVTLPRVRTDMSPRSVRDRLTRGLRVYLATPRLRGLLALNLVAAAGGAMVIVNTVVIVRDGLGRGDRAVALALACYGAGSMAVALLLPRLLRGYSDRTAMLSGAVALIATLAGLAALWPLPENGAVAWGTLLGAWLVLGAGYAALVTPGGRLLRRSADEAQRPALFVAQFSLSHLCWLLTYPLVGWLGVFADLGASLWAMAAVATAGTLLAWRLWPRSDPEVIEHAHDDLPADHPHVAGDMTYPRHAHTFVLDDLHTRWPSR
ncbi:MFS transporter [soil metagenome]